MPTEPVRSNFASKGRGTVRGTGVTVSFLLDLDGRRLDRSGW